jgi:nucleotide-binding universal stress UspA family protein
MRGGNVKGISSVLCAVDIAEPGQVAFEHALSLARSHDATLLIVHGVPLGRSFNSGGAERTTYLRDLNVRAQRAGVDVRVSVQSGEAAEIILLHARARQSGLVVVSAQHGKVHGRASQSSHDPRRMGPVLEAALVRRVSF